MLEIWKYNVLNGQVIDSGDDSAYYIVKMPEHSNIIFCGNQRENITLWAEVIPGPNTEPKTVVVVGTGHKFDSSNLHYIGSVILSGGDYIFHIYEKS